MAKLDFKQPNYIKALEATQSIITREVSADLGILRGVSATMQPLTGADDLRIKTNKSNMIAFNKLINEFLYDKGGFTGIQFESFDDFESKLSVPDKEILIALLLDASYTELPQRTAFCPECGAENTYNMTVAELFNNPKTKLAQWDHEEPFYEKIFSKEFSDGILKLNIKFPSEKERNEVFSIMNLDTIRKNILEKGTALDSTDTLLMFIDSIEINVPTEDGKTEKVVLDKKLPDIRGYLDNAPLAVHNLFKNFINGTFEKYNSEFYYSVTCDKCAHKYDVPVSPETEFFRQALY